MVFIVSVIVVIGAIIATFSCFLSLFLMFQNWVNFTLKIHPLQNLTNLLPSYKRDSAAKSQGTDILGD